MSVRRQFERVGWLIVRLARGADHLGKSIIRRFEVTIPKQQTATVKEQVAPPARVIKADLSGDRDIEWSWVGGNLPEVKGDVLDFGPSTATTCLAAALGGGNVIGIDLEAQPAPTYALPNLTMVRGDILTYDFGPRRFDTIINCSTVEHVGLSGRYGSTEAPEGDLQAMQRLRSLMRGPASRMVLTIPVGIDGVFTPFHRVYGAERFPKLTAGFSIVKEAYFAKPPNDWRWMPTTRDAAFAVQGSASFYALGLFVLAPA